MSDKGDPSSLAGCSGRNHLYKEFRSCEIRKQQIERDEQQLSVELDVINSRMADIEAALMSMPSVSKKAVPQSRHVSKVSAKLILQLHV